MHSVNVIILHAFVAQATANEDTFVDKLVDKLMDRVNEASLDGTTLGKTHKDAALGSPMMRGASCIAPQAVCSVQNKLAGLGMAPSAMQTLALTAVDAHAHGEGMRNVAALASRMPSSVQAEVSKLNKEVVVKAGALKAEDMPGVTAPLGFWDPWGISTKVGDESLVFFREIELKHGRAAMLCTLGIIAGEYFSPFFGWTDPTPAAALFLKPVPVGGAQFWGAVLVLTAFGEAAAENNKLWGERDIGDMGWDPLNLKPKTAEGLKEMQNKELNNGRLAMFAASGMIAQELVTGEKIFR